VAAAVKTACTVCAADVDWALGSFVADAAGVQDESAKASINKLIMKGRGLMVTL
jgi:hypothetical protein